MNKKFQKNILVGGVFVTLSFLPGCGLLDSFKGDNQAAEGETMQERRAEAPLTGDVLVTMKGRPVITSDTLAAEKEKFLKANPQIKQALGFMDPKAFDRNLLEGLIGQKIADEYVISQKINQTAAYKAELKDLCESMERMLNAKYFSEKQTVTVPDSDVRAFYDANKDKLRGVVMSAGGVMASGIEFNDGAAARAFAARAKSAPGGFKKVAQDDDLNAKIKDFKLVNSYSMGMDEQLRDKIVNIKTVPSIEVFDINGKFWVINATTKEEAKYVPYDQVKDKLKQELEQNKRVEIFEKEINNLRKEYGVEVNEDYFKGAEMPQEPDMQEMMETQGGMAQTIEQKDKGSKDIA
jgi:PPIC-type PPIASE domain